MELRITMLMMALGALFTLIWGVAQSLLCGGLVALDLQLPPMCSAIQGVGIGIMVAAGYLFFVGVQGIAIIGASRRVSWAYSLTLALAVIYCFVGFLPLGVMIIVLMTRPSAKASFHPPLVDEGSASPPH